MVTHIKFLLFAYSFCCLQIVLGQKNNYDLSKVHSHNDYWQKRPFWNAYEHGLGSIEADTYLKNGQILIGHNPEDLNDSITLQKMYLEPLSQLLKANNSLPFKSNHAKHLQLMIEMKSVGDSEIYPLISLLEKYPEIAHNKNLSVVITGHLPSNNVIEKMPLFVQFDGQIRYDYSPEVLEHIALLSDDLQHFVKWNGKEKINSSDYETLQSFVVKVHKLGKKVRFWNAPDNPLAWETFLSLGVDFVNTDHIEAIAEYFNKK